MAGRQAKVLQNSELRKLLAVAGRGQMADRNRVVLLLAVTSGLRAREISRITWAMVLDPSGRIGKVIEVRDSISKCKSGRRIPMHLKLRMALIKLRRSQPPEHVGPDSVVVRSQRQGAQIRANSIVNLFIALSK